MQGVDTKGFCIFGQWNMKFFTIHVVDYAIKYPKELFAKVGNKWWLVVMALTMSWDEVFTVGAGWR